MWHSTGGAENGVARGAPNQLGHACSAPTCHARTQRPLNPTTNTAAGCSWPNVNCTRATRASALYPTTVPAPASPPADWIANQLLCHPARHRRPHHPRRHRHHRLHPTAGTDLHDFDVDGGVGAVLAPAPRPSAVATIVGTWTQRRSGAAAQRMAQGQLYTSNQTQLARVAPAGNQGVLCWAPAR